MAYHPLFRDFVFKRTDGACHLCGGLLVLCRYGCLRAVGAWEVDHDIPRAVGGDDSFTNLLPAHPSCNRSKQALPSSQVRLRNGLSDRPLSSGEKLMRRVDGMMEAMAVMEAAREKANRQAVAALGFAAGGAGLGALIGAGLGTSEEDRRNKAAHGALLGGLALGLVRLLAAAV